MKATALAEVDPEARARIESACGFVNHKIEQSRGRVRFAALLIIVGAAVLWATTPLTLQHAAYGAVALIVFAHVQAKREVNRWYKRLVIGRVVEAVGRGLSYSATSSLTAERFHALHVLADSGNTWKSEDEVRGERNGVAFALHEVKVTRESRKTEKILFRGVVVELEFNKHFRGHTVVLPDREARGLLGEADAWKGKRRVPMGHPAFEERFTVFSDDDQQAHYVLTPKLMDLLVRADRAHGGKLRLAFLDDHLAVGVPLDHDLFEVGLGTRATMIRAFDDLARAVRLAGELIDALELETRIWTRA